MRTKLAVTYLIPSIIGVRERCAIIIIHHFHEQFSS